MRVLRICGFGLASLAAIAPGIGWPAAAGARSGAKEERVKLVVFVKPTPDLPSKTLVKVNQRIERALKKNRRLQVSSPDLLLARFSGEIPSGALAKLGRNIRKGFRALEKRRYGAAVVHFRAAQAEELRALAYIKRSQLAMTQFGLALSLYLTLQRRLAQQVITKLLTWRPHLRVNPKVVPKGFLRMVNRIRRGVLKGKKGSLTLITRPRKARLYLNGHFVGLAPLTLEGVPVGTHYLMVAQEGYHRHAEKVTIPALRRRARVEVLLRPSSKYILLSQALKRSWPAFGRKRTSAAMQEIRTLLLQDQLLLVKPSPPSASGVRIEACLYDLRTRNLLKRLSYTLKGRRLLARPFATALYANVRYDGLLADPGEEAGPEIVHKPIYKRWWFWVSIGVAVVAITVGTAVPLSQRESSNIPEGHNPITIQF